MKVDCLLSDWAPWDQARAMHVLWELKQLGAKTMKGTPKFRFCHFSATPEEMGRMVLVLWGVWALVGSSFHPLFKAWLRLMAGGQGQAPPA